jgi:hypothetical protein
MTTWIPDENGFKMVKNMLEPPIELPDHFISEQLSSYQMVQTSLDHFVFK